MKDFQLVPFAKGFEVKGEKVKGMWQQSDGALIYFTEKGVWRLGMDVGYFKPVTEGNELLDYLENMNG